jgi:dihydrolipoamide dehydrogenase
MEEFDLAIIGSGPAGYSCALRAAKLGAKVYLIEKKELGGVCLNRGCIPTKTLLHAAKIYSQAKHSARLGIKIDNPSFSLEKLKSYKEEVVSQLRSGLENLLKAKKITLVYQEGKIVSPKKLLVQNQEIFAKHILLACGAKTKEIPGFPIDEKNILSSDGILNLVEIPRSLLIIGAGVIGCEMACFFHELGCKVALVEALERILPNEDKEMAKRLELSLKKRGIDIFVQTKVEKQEKRDNDFIVTLSDGKKVTVEKILVCVGRSANSEGLENLALRFEERSPWIDEYLQTSQSGVYAAGDILGKTMLAHLAVYQGRLAAENMFGVKQKADYRAVPNAIFTYPQFASVGLTEDAAKTQGLAVRVLRLPFGAIGLSRIIAETDGLIKVVLEAKTQKVLGGQIIGAQASELISEFTLAVRWEMALEQIAQTIHAHPTFSEIFSELAEQL